jgi:uncharacterized protein (DUF1697 family)
MRYLVLLRGINVGGKNLIKMPELRAALERSGFRNVTTYIQSGNVLLESKFKNSARLSGAIEEAVAKEFGSIAAAVIFSEEQVERIVVNAPRGFGADPVRYRYDVIFIKPPLIARDILPGISLKDEVDEASEGNGVLYFRRLIERASQSHLSKLVSTAAYNSMTIRNWNTTCELHRLLLHR